MLATIQDYCVSLTKDGNPQIAIEFMCEDGALLTWRGSLKEGKAQEITFKALDVCGFKESDPSLLSAGASSGLLDTQKEVDLTIEDEEWQGKTYKKVKWVNRVGGQGFKNVMSKEEVVKFFSEINLKASFAKHRALNPKAKEDVPF